MFVERLSRKTEGRLNIEHQHSARFFRDRNVIKALSDGKVEMAVPGTWQFDRFEPNVGVFLLPMFYGRGSAINYRLRDGEIGQDLNRRLEQVLDIKVLGRWIDLGYAHLYGVEKPIRTHQDLSGMLIRIPGGEANAARLAALGAVPKIISWPDLPSALEHGTVEGLLTTHATVVSARLWEKGIRHAFEDRQYFPQYIPIISQSFWKRLPQDLRLDIAETWEGVVETGRKMAAQAQKEAYSTLVENGVNIVTPSTIELKRWRRRMAARQPGLVKRMGIDPKLVDAIRLRLGD